MKMLSTITMLRVVDVLEGRATIENVEPALQQDVAAALAVYQQVRTPPAIDTVDDDLAAVPDTPAPAEEVTGDGSAA